MRLIKLLSTLVLICVAGYVINIFIRQNAEIPVLPKTEYVTAAVINASSSIPETKKSFSVLIVPGHDTNTGGAKYRDLYERDLVVDIAKNIANELQSNPEFKILVARDTKTWDSVLQNYFDNEEASILDFKNEHQAAYKQQITSGKSKFVPDMANHSSVDKKTAVELYGINKWSNEHDVDLVLHLHLNDSERKNANQPGWYSGFTMFVPEAQLPNSSTSVAIAENIYKELAKVLKPEIVGNKKTSIIQDQSLIAVGASETLKKPAILIEYGYIYDKLFTNKTERAKNLQSVATQTVLGLRDYLSEINQINQIKPL